jgi:hypothetical protein
LQGLQNAWAGNLRWAWWVSCSSSSPSRSSSRRRELSCTKQSTPRTLWGSSRWRTPRPWQCLWVQLQPLMWSRKVSLWTRRSTEAWSGHSCTWRRRGQTSNSQYVCALVLKCLQGLLIGKQLSADSGICEILQTLAFGTPRLLLWFFLDFHTWIFLLGVAWIRSPLLGLANFCVPL